SLEPASYQGRGGTYRLTATTRDALGRRSESELRVWVSGAEAIPARDVQLEAITLVPDHQDPAPGTTVSILVQAPFSPAEGVLTLRRDGLVSTERFRMDGPTTTLKVPIVEAYVPNVTVQVDLVGAAGRPGADGKVDPSLPKRIAHASGSIGFTVPPGSRTLAVTATPAATAAAPGSETTIALEVRRADGSPVAGAEVAVVVADESVLALTGYALPDPIEVFYAAREPGVADLRLRAFAALADPTRLVAPASVPSGAAAAPGDFAGEIGLAEERSENKADKSEVARRASTSTTTGRENEYRVDAKKAKITAGLDALGYVAGNGSAPAIAMRTDLSALALFAPDVTTDAAGRATVPLKLPDSLTRYRVMVVAVDAERSFGSADTAITARLPLMVRPSAPRFLNFGDQVELPVVVQNQTDAPLDVSVAVRGTNVRFVDAVGPTLPDAPDLAVSTAGRRVTVPANDRVEVRFPAATVMAGTARFQAVAAAGAVSDAATFSVPVWTPATSEAFATYGEIDGPGVVQPVQAPPGAWPQFGGLEVTTSSTQLQALTDAVLYLESYPFECNEQLSSRVLGIASLRDVLSAFGAAGLPDSDALDARVAADLERLAQRQNWDGGYSFWRKGDESWPLLSIHVANAFARAKAKGYGVPDDAWARSQQHLRDIRSHIPSWYDDESRWFLEAYALDVRRRMSDADPTRAKALYREAGDRLGIDGLAFLLPTLHDAHATEEAAILRRLANQVTESARDAHFVTDYTDGAYLLLHSDRRADGIVLEALIETNPQDPLIPKVVRGLLGHQTKGRWGNTQENAFVLLALDRYFRVYEAETPAFVAKVWLGDDYIGEHAFRGRTTERSQIDVPMGPLTEHPGAVPLTLVKDGTGRMYYRIGVRYAPKDLRLGPADYGFAVERTYQAIDDPEDVTRDADGVWHVAAGARVRVHLSMSTEMRRTHVALVDPLPAGLEAQNAALATTGTLPSAPPDAQPSYWWWTRSWWEHENLRDERVEAFTSLLWDGVYSYDYVARATTPGRFVVPPTRAEEMYAPETFGRSGTDLLIVE
ncbi:MAG: alpha-2-macroglobulin family protein, partial [Myxococcota bacterium]